MSQHTPETAIIGTDISHKLAATAILAQAGLSQGETAKALGITRQAVGLRLRKLPKGCDLTSGKNVKLASRAVKNLVAGQRFGDIEKVGAQTALEAAKMIYDRAQPIKGSDSGPAISYTEININLFKA